MDPLTAKAQVSLEARLAQLQEDLAEAVDRSRRPVRCCRPSAARLSALEPVFETVLRHAVRLCAADAGMVYQLEGDVYRLACVVGGSAEYRRYLEERPIPHGPGSLVGRVELERRTLQIADAAADPRYEWQEARELGGFRTMLGVPMVVDDGASSA